MMNHDNIVGFKFVRRGTNEMTGTTIYKHSNDGCSRFNWRRREGRERIIRLALELIVIDLTAVACRVLLLLKTWR
jgi:hypothetical protein